MIGKNFLSVCALALAASIWFVSPAGADDAKTPVPAIATAPSAAPTRLFEYRKYTANPGKLDALLARFRDHTNALFEKHGMTVIGYWVPTDEKLSKNTLVYILAFSSKEARDKAWAEFHADPEWLKVKADSEKDGPLLIEHGIESHFMTPTDFSPIK